MIVTAQLRGKGARDVRLRPKTGLLAFAAVLIFSSSAVGLAGCMGHPARDGGSRAVREREPREPPCGYCRGIAERARLHCKSHGGSDAQCDREASDVYELCYMQCRN